MSIERLQGEVDDVAREVGGRARLRSRGARAALLCTCGALVALGGIVSEAFSRPGPAPTLSAPQTFVVFNHEVTLSGTATTHRVTLLARHFGATSYHAVSTARVRNGTFRFSPIPILATSYKVAAGTSATPASHPVRVYVHLDVTRFSCSLCIPSPPTGQQQLRYGLVIRVPSADYHFVLSQPVYLYVGTSTGKVTTEKRVGSAKPVGIGHSTVRVSGVLSVDVPVGGRVRFTACDRSLERQTGVGLPSVHDCGDPQLTHEQFMGYVG